MTTASVLPPSPPPLPALRSAAPRTSVRISSPGHVAGAIAQLAALGAIGPAVFGGLFSLLGAGVGLLFAVLIGVVVLAGLVYALYAVAWFEQARLEGLYGFELPALRVRRSPKPGFVGVLHTIWLQAIDPRQWRAIASFTVSTVLGVVALLLVGAVAWGLALAVSPIFGWTPVSFFGLLRLNGVAGPLVGALLALVAVGALVGLGLLHGVLARAILVPSREALLEEQARTSDTRRAGAVRAAEVERTRIERDLHDGVQPRLVSIGMTLGLAQTKIDDDPEAAKALVAEAHASTKSAITELRQLARGIHASVLEDRGLDAALSALASRSHIPVTLDVRLPRRCSRAAEAAVYFSIAEALTNAAKHSRAGNCRVDVRVRDDGSLWARVEDDGLGGARIVPGGGLDGIVNRVTAAGGTARIDSPQGGPTTVEVTVPCAS
ncbi:sensor histidine kinase [Microbacterium sp. T32]|uniref:sensor histidine kinase n=1 Tax=Microbacterium sp. T32 TaxID=1776083 RepID=UPI0007AB80FC|nr:histidine kinase [Microbacterium sp. T32]KZE41763.1 histidine kinase [Microbacterium sp. T32]